MGESGNKSVCTCCFFHFSISLCPCVRGEKRGSDRGGRDVDCAIVSHFLACMDGCEVVEVFFVVVMFFPPYSTDPLVSSLVCHFLLFSLFRLFVMFVTTILLPHLLRLLFRSGVCVDGVCSSRIL